MNLKVGDSIFASECRGLCSCFDGCIGEILEVSPEHAVDFKYKIEVRDKLGEIVMYMREDGLMFPPGSASNVKFTIMEPFEGNV